LRTGRGRLAGHAEAPTKLVNAGFSPFIISMGMVMGAFRGALDRSHAAQGHRLSVSDLRDKPHLIVWALLAGMLWAVANTLTIFAVRNVGLAIAFPLWNTNSLVGLFWGWLLFKELRGSGFKGWSKVLGGAFAIVGGAAVLAYATASQSDTPGKAAVGIVAALGAGVLLGTMYIPYRKAYISGMNPLSFVTIFTFGELGTVLTLGSIYMAASAMSSANCTVLGPCSSGRSSAASAGSSATSSRTLRQSISASGAAFRSPTPISFGDWRGARWSSGISGLSVSGKAAHPHRIAGDDSGALSISMADPAHRSW
jgi:drug/metabolite transporter (DMT)-like permease